MSLFGDGGMFSFSNCLIGTIPGSIGETSALACLIGAALLIWTGIASWRIIGSFLAGGLVMGALFNVFDANAFMGIPPYHQVVMGGFMFEWCSWPRTLSVRPKPTQGNCGMRILRRVVQYPRSGVQSGISRGNDGHFVHERYGTVD